MALTWWNIKPFISSLPCSCFCGGFLLPAFLWCLNWYKKPRPLKAIKSGLKADAILSFKGSRAGLLRSIKVCWTSACKLVALFLHWENERRPKDFESPEDKLSHQWKMKLKIWLEMPWPCLQFVYHFSPLRIASGMKSNMAEAPSWCIKGMKRRPAWKKEKSSWPSSTSSLAFAAVCTKKF